MRKNIFSITILCSMIVIVSSCNESVVTPGRITVNGQVGGDLRFITDGEVIIGSKSVFLDQEGKFTIEDVETPYDVIYRLNENNFYIFKGLNSSQIFLNRFPGFQDYSSIANINLNVNVPTNSGQRMCLYFQPDESIPVSVVYNSGPAQWNVLWNKNNSNQITGKIILIYYSLNGNEIVSYDRYGEKPVTLNYGPNNVFFDSTDLIFNPGERTITCRVINNAGGNVYSDLILNFTSFNPLQYDNSFGQHQVSSGTISFIVPDNLPAPFTIYIRGFQDGVSNRNWQTVKYNEGISNEINFYVAPSPISPSENDSVSIYNTQFFYEQGGGNGIFASSIINRSVPTKEIIIYSGDNNFVVNDLSTYGFDPLEFSNDYTWTITKYMNFESLDDFVNGNPGLRNSFRGWSWGASTNILLQ